jgi:predicted nucleotidyltransferase
VELVSLTSEGKVLATLWHGRHSYGELRLETGLSDRWLTVKLNELLREKVVVKSGRWYSLARELDVSSYELSLYMSFQARQVARELAKLRSVLAIVLFGGVAQKRAHPYSDLDMVIVVSEPVDDVKEEVLSRVSELEWKYHVMVEPLILARKDFLDNVNSREGGIVYGLAESCEVLVDKTGELGKLLRNRIEEIRRSHDYLEEARIWLKVK